MMVGRRIAGVFVAMALLGAACSGDEDSPTSITGSPTTTEAEGGGGGGEELTISAEDIAFSADTLTGAAGELTITFENNDDGIQHNFHVTIGDEEFKTEIAEGPTTQELELTVDDPGEYDFVCDVHPDQMTGTLVIE